MSSGNQDKCSLVWNSEGGVDIIPTSQGEWMFGYPASSYITWHTKPATPEIVESINKFILGYDPIRTELSDNDTEIKIYDTENNRFIV